MPLYIVVYYDSKGVEDYVRFKIAKMFFFISFISLGLLCCVCTIAHEKYVEVRAALGTLR